MLLQNLINQFLLFLLLSSLNVSNVIRALVFGFKLVSFNLNLQLSSILSLFLCFNRTKFRRLKSTSNIQELDNQSKKEFTSATCLRYVFTIFILLQKLLKVICLNSDLWTVQRIHLTS